MKWSVSVVAEGDRETTLDEIVALADAVATMSGIASGFGSMSYGAQMVIEAISADAAVEIAVPGSLDRTIRVMVHVESELSKGEISHIYLHGAKALRTDIAQ